MIHVYILDPIYPHSFMENDNPSEEEMDAAIKNMTSALEQKIKEKAEILYE